MRLHVVSTRGGIRIECPQYNFSAELTRTNTLDLLRGAIPAIDVRTELLHEPGDAGNSVPPMFDIGDDSHIRDFGYAARVRRDAELFKSLQKSISGNPVLSRGVGATGWRPTEPLSKGTTAAVLKAKLASMNLKVR